MSRDVPDGVAVFGDGRPLPVLLRYAMPRAGVHFSRQLVHYGFAPDTGRASKHHSYEDHGSKPECPGLHE